MRQPLKTVAVIAANPALSSILGMMLASDPALRVRQFETQGALATYVRLSPVDLVVADFECAAAPADVLTLALRDNLEIQRADFEVIALTHVVDARIRAAALRAGIDEVIVKPISPRYLQERVTARLRRREIPVGRRQVVPAALPDNVVRLFPLRSELPA